MRLVALLMVVSGLIVGTGAGLEFLYFGPEARQFWVGVYGTPASLFFAGAGLLLWRRGRDAHRLVLIAALVMAAATAAATAMDVMGPIATLIGGLGALVAGVWAWRVRVSSR